MAFGNEADDFMKSFTNVLSLYSRFDTKDEKRIKRAQAEALERANSPEAIELERRKTESGIADTKSQTRYRDLLSKGQELEQSPEEIELRRAGTRADTRLKSAQAAGAEFMNSPEMQELTKLGAQGEINWKKADTDRLNEVVNAARYANTPEQRALADQQIQSTIALQNANAAQATAYAQGLSEEAIAKARQNAYNLTASQLPIAIKQFQLGQPPEITAQAEKALGVPPGFFEKYYGKGSDADADLFNRSVEPAPGPQSRREAIPLTQDQAMNQLSGAGSVQQAAYTLDDLVDMHDDDEGHDGGPSGASAIEQEAVPVRDVEAGTSGGASGTETGRIIQAQAGTRRQPISDRLYSTLEQAAADTGLTVRVTSGGQPSSGPNRTGSHRHDHGNAADLQLIDENGHVLDMKDDTDRARMADFISLSKKYGATGIGAAEDYMGTKTLHIGFGSPAVWGAGGRGKNAPDWVRNAYNSVGGGGGGGGTQASAEPQTRRAPPKLVDDGTQLAYNAWRGIAKAGLRIGAVQDDQSQSAAKGVLTGQGAMDKQVLAQATDTYNRNIPQGYQQTLAERNLGMFAVMANSGMTPEERERAAAQLVQSFRQKALQFSAIGKALADDGRLDEGAKALVRAYAYIPTGYDADVTKTKDGKYALRVWDMKDPNRVLQEQLLTPEEMYAKIMQTSPMDFDRGMASLAHIGKEPSPEYLRSQAAIATGEAPRSASTAYLRPRGASRPGPGPAQQQPEVMDEFITDPSQTSRAVGAPRQAIPTPNYAAMDQSLGEPERARAEYSAAETRRNAANTASAQPGPRSPEEVEQMRSDLGTALNNAAGSQVGTLVQTLVDTVGPDNLNVMAGDIKRLNPAMPTQDVLYTLASMANPVDTPSGGTSLRYKLYPADDQTMQNAVKVQVALKDPTRGGSVIRQDVNMSEETFRALDNIARQNLAARQQENFTAEQAAYRGRVGDATDVRRRAEANSPYAGVTNQIELMRNQIGQARANGLDTSDMERRLRYLEQKKAEQSGYRGALPPY